MGALVKNTGFASSQGPPLEELNRCIRCGACLNSCPTYLELGLEADSPRGRLQLMKAAAEGRLDMSRQFVEHMYRCLDCRACETACPAGVHFGRVMEATRAQIGQGARDSAWAKALYWLFFRQLLPYPHRLEAVAWLLRSYQRSPLSYLAHGPLQPLVPKHLMELEAILPLIPDRYSSPSKPHVVPALEKERHRVQFFSGCVMNLIFPQVNEATVRVLSRNGCTVLVPSEQRCCGALHAHNGDQEMATALARRNIDTFEQMDGGAIIVNSAGCGAMLKGYRDLLKDDSDYSERAERFSQRVLDVSEFLASIHLDGTLQTIRRRVTYQDPCHLAHAQGVRQQPRELLKAIPGLELVEMSHPDECCGSAGIYNVTEYDLAIRILDRKIQDIAATGAEMVVTANPGCLLQLNFGLRRHRMETSVVHLVVLLEEAYRDGTGG